MNDLTEKEKELIQAIRNYRLAYPNGKRELKWLVKQILAELMTIN